MPKIDLTESEKAIIEIAIKDYLAVLEKHAKKSADLGLKAVSEFMIKSIKSVKDLQNKLL